MVYNVSHNPTLGPSKLPVDMPPSLVALSAANVGLVGKLDAAGLGAGLWHLDLASNALQGALPGGDGGIPLQEVGPTRARMQPHLPRTPDAVTRLAARALKGF
jgi:hypothetical protein